MNVADRVINILMRPKTEWLSISKENSTSKSLLISYVLPLAFLASLGQFLQRPWESTRLFDYSYFLWPTVTTFISIIIAFYISIYVIDLLAPGFGSEKNLNKSARLIAYSNTPVWIAGFLSFIPVVGLLFTFSGWLYSIYLFYLGLGILKRTPEDKKVIYMVVAFIVMVAISIIIRALLMAILFGFGVLAGTKNGVLGV